MPVKVSRRMNRTSRKSSGALASLLKSSVYRLPERFVQTLSERAVRRRDYYYTQKKVKCKHFFCKITPLRVRNVRGFLLGDGSLRRHARNQQTSYRAEKVGLLGELLPTIVGKLRIRTEARATLYLYYISSEEKCNRFSKNRKMFFCFNDLNLTKRKS